MRSIMKSFSSGVARSGALRPTPAVLESLWFPPRLINQARQKPLLWPVTHALGTTGTYSGAGEYTAASNPELRKNPGLYQGLSTAASSNGAAPAGGSGDSEPAVSFMVNAQAKGSSPKALTKPEILSPVGGWPQMRAAVENGADAVYFGLTDFNARARASNFDPEELPQVMEYLHDRGVKGYVTFNVLVFDEEMAAVEARVRQMAQAGVDAVIVQDLGVVELMRRVAPGLPVHGSTQMSITSAEGADFANSLGVDRVVVGRELSVREIAKVHAGAAPEVEAFVHGALCVSYSGQCFSSEAWGGRSANRGQCAQACRLPYGLIVDGALKDMHDAKYLLSPQDLMAVELVPELVRAGVSCFKIEGRLKGPEYVALTTQVYRRAVDAAWAQITGQAPTPGTPPSFSLTSRDRWDLEQVFARGQDAASRGLTPGFLAGVRHQELVRGRAPRHRGVYAGRVVSVERAAAAPGGRAGPAGRDAGGQRGAGAGPAVPGAVAVTLELAAPLKRGDGLVFDAGAPEDKEEGGTIYDLLDDRGRSLQGEIMPTGVDAGAPAAASSSTTSTSSSSQKGKAGAGSQGRSTNSASAGGAKSSGARSGGAGAAGAAGAPTRVTVVFGPGQVVAARVKPGHLVWKTKDHALEARLKSSYDGLASAALRRVGVTARVVGRVGEPLTLTLRDDAGHESCATTSALLGQATSRPMAAEDVAKALGQTLGDAEGSLALQGVPDCSGLALEQGLFLPASELKAVRRAAVEALLHARRTHDRAAGLASEPVLPRLLSEAAARPVPAPAAAASSGQAAAAAGSQDGEEAVASSSSKKGGAAALQAAGRQAQLRVLCRSPEQVTAALQVPWLQEVVLDFLEVHGLKEAVAQVRASGRSVTVATPRVLKPDEERLVHFYLRLRPDALLVRSAGLMHQLSRLGGAGATLHGLADAQGAPLAVPQLHGDFSLNAANALTADLLLGPRGALARLAPTHDLSAAQICGLARALGSVRAGAHLEAVLHQHLPIFHTEHCVFARCLSSGNSYKDCGHPCERHTVHLRDGDGRDHLVLADMGCRNTVFNAQAQSGVFYAPDLLRAGLRSFRVELVDEPAEVVGPLLQGYRDVLDGKRGPGDLWRWLGTLPDANGRSHGVGHGSLGGGLQSDRPRAAMKPTAAALKSGAGGAKGAGPAVAARG